MAANNSIYLEWDILYEGTKTKKQRNKAIKAILYGIESTVKPGGESIPLKYEIFKSETNKSLYILRVYRKDGAKSGSAQIAASVDPPEDFSGPIRPSGPPPTPPPGVSRISQSI